jgi:3-oxoadipate enol-lactonase
MSESPQVHAKLPWWSGGEVHAGGLLQYVRRSGRVGAPPLVLLHGLAVHGGMWLGLRDALEPHFDLVVPDLRGHGLTGTPPGAWSIDDYADDVIALLDSLGLKKVHVAGYSMGGFVALSLAIRHPKRVERLGLLCTAAAHLDRRRRVGLHALHTALGVTRPEAMKEVTSRLLAGPGMPPEMAEVYRWLMARNTRRGLRGAVDSMLRLDHRPALGALAAPTLVVTAGRDVAFARRDWEPLLSVRDVRHRHWEEAGHGLIVSHSAELSGELVRFFAPGTGS